MNIADLLPPGFNVEDLLITMSAFGAVTLYAVSMVSLINLRMKEPNLERPYHTPCYPVFPVVALVLAILSLVTMTWLNIDRQEWWKSISLWYFGYLVIAFAWYWLFIRDRITEADIEHFRQLEDEDDDAK